MTASATLDLDLELMRASLLLESDPAAAARRAHAMLAAAPGHSEASLLLAAACRKLGDPAAAAAALESLPAAHLDTPFMQLELGRAYAAAGRGAEARAAFGRAVALDEGLADGWRELAAVQFAAGDIQAGDAAYANYTKSAPAPPELVDAQVALADNRLDTAQGLLLQRLRQAPGDVAALRLLADTATRRQDHAEAERRLTECLQLAPGHAGARFDLANLLHTLHRHSEVLPLLERLLTADPHNLEYITLRAQALRMVGRNDEAVAVMEQAVAGHPGADGAWLLYGHLLREIGQQTRAIEMYQQALVVRPQSGRAYSSLADLKTFRFTDEDLAAMREQLAQSAVRGLDRIHLEFALGKALEDEAQFALSFEHYARGNALHRATIVHNPDGITADVQRSKRLYSAGFFAERQGWGSGKPDPIFIVGLPRSGSTLLEQILASHSQVEGTRELTDIPSMAGELPDFPESVATLGSQDVEQLAASYLSRTQLHRPLGKARFVDKMLANFAHVGFIHLMFPRAAIIDTRRHPLGCGFSCYKQLFARELNYTYELSELGRYYHDYAELMEHFDSVLPQRVHRVHYEQLVGDPDGEVRRLLDYCGLPFEAECLRFYDNRRVVQTISSEQVRRPIYADSVDHWRHYEPWLGPLKDALGDLVERYPGAVR